MSDSLCRLTLSSTVIAVGQKVGHVVTSLPVGRSHLCHVKRTTSWGHCLLSELNKRRGHYFQTSSSLPPTSLSLKIQNRMQWVVFLSFPPEHPPPVCCSFSSKQTWPHGECGKSSSTTSLFHSTHESQRELSRDPGEGSLNFESCNGIFVNESMGRVEIMVR